MPATFFVNTDRLTEEHERWWDILERVFLGADTLPSSLRITIAGQNLQMPTTTARERADALECLNRMAWPLDASARAELAAHVAAWSGVDVSPRSTHRVLTDDEIRALATRPGHSIGAHTVHHLALTTQPADTKRKEIVENKVALERVLQQPVRLFSYPYGEFDADLVRIAGEAGFLAAVTVQAGLVSAGMNRLLLPRFEITPRHHGVFAAHMREIFEGREGDTTLKRALKRGAEPGGVVVPRHSFQRRLPEPQPQIGIRHRANRSREQGRAGSSAASSSIPASQPSCCARSGVQTIGTPRAAASMTFSDIPAE